MLVEDWHVFFQGLEVGPALPLSDPDVSAFFNEMGKQRGKIWKLCETVDRVRPVLRRGIREMFPENPPKYGVESYTAQTGC